MGLFCLLLSPFVVLTAVGLWKGLVGHGVGVFGGVLMAEGSGSLWLKAPTAGADFAGAVSRDAVELHGVG